jgi:hypothetical protein
VPALVRIAHAGRHLRPKLLEYANVFATAKLFVPIIATAIVAWCSPSL